MAAAQGAVQGAAEGYARTEGAIAGTAAFAAETAVNLGVESTRTMAFGVFDLPRQMEKARKLAAAASSPIQSVKAMYGGAMDKAGTASADGSLVGQFEASFHFTKGFTAPVASTVLGAGETAVGAARSATAMMTSAEAVGGDAAVISENVTAPSSGSGPMRVPPSDPYDPAWGQFYRDNPGVARMGPGAASTSEPAFATKPLEPAGEISGLGRKAGEPITISAQDLQATAKAVRRHVDKLNTRGIGEAGEAFQDAVKGGDYRTAGTIAHNRMFKRLNSIEFQTTGGDPVLINRGPVYPPAGVSPGRGFSYRLPDIQYGPAGSQGYAAWDFKGDGGGWPFADSTGQFADIKDWTGATPTPLFYHWR